MARNDCAWAAPASRGMHVRKLSTSALVKGRQQWPCTCQVSLESHYRCHCKLEATTAIRGSDSAGESKSFRRFCADILFATPCRQ